MAANPSLPASVLAPRMQHSSREDGWLVMVFDFLDARDADLSPGSPDLDGVVSGSHRDRRRPRLGRRTAGQLRT